MWFNEAREYTSAFKILGVHLRAGSSLGDLLAPSKWANSYDLSTVKGKAFERRELSARYGDDGAIIEDNCRVVRWQSIPGRWKYYIAQIKIFCECLSKTVEPWLARVVHIELSLYVLGREHMQCIQNQKEARTRSKTRIAVGCSARKDVDVCTACIPTKRMSHGNFRKRPMQITS